MRPRPDLDGRDVGDAESCQHVVEEVHRHVAHRVVDDQREEEIVEEHIEAVQPEILPDARLVLAPGEKDLSGPRKERKSHQPPEVIAPVEVRDLPTEVVPIARVGVDDDVPVVLHVARREATGWEWEDR